MVIYLDGKEIVRDTTELELIKKHLQENNLIISSLMLNDTEMVNSPLEEVLSNTGQEQVVTIETYPAYEFCMEVLNEAVSYIPNLKQGILSIREMILEGNENQARVTIDQAVEGLEWVVITMEAAAIQSADLEVKNNLTEELSASYEIFTQFADALQKDDLTFICDLLEYEFNPLLSKLHDIALQLLYQQKQ